MTVTETHTLARAPRSGPMSPAAAIPAAMGEVCATALTAAQFDAGLTLLASMHATDRVRPVLICDLGLTAAQRAVLDQVAGVSVFRPRPGTLRAQGLRPALRTGLMLQAVEVLGQAASVIWLDPDIALYRSLDPLFATIRQEGACLPANLSAIGNEADCGMFGIRMDGSNAALLRASLERPAQTDRGALEEFARQRGPHLPRIEGTITDIDDLNASAPPRAERWLSMPAGRLRRGDLAPGTVGLRHRGVVKDFSGLVFRHTRRPACAVLGNGPSLADVDLPSLDDMDTIGMNAAFRFWHQIGWYPTMYCCLDEVVGMSLKTGILDLVANRRRFGIEQFVVRRNLFDWLDDQGATDGVICFDLLRDGYDLLLSNPVTTGSHAMGWVAACGHTRLMLAGIDGNYVEKIPGAQLHDEIVLEIVAEGENPNYFFDGYQQVGDRYMLPNPSEGMHLRSWHHIRQRLPEGVVVVNANPASHVDAFPRMPLAAARAFLKTPA